MWNSGGGDARGKAIRIFFWSGLNSLLTGVIQSGQCHADSMVKKKSRRQKGCFTKKPVGMWNQIISSAANTKNMSFKTCRLKCWCTWSRRLIKNRDGTQINNTHNNAANLSSLFGTYTLICCHNKPLKEQGIQVEYCYEGNDKVFESRCYDIKTTSLLAV